MRQPLLAALMAAWTISLGPLALAQPHAQALVEINAADAVAATTIAAAATQAAEQRVADQAIRGLRANVDRLEARLASGQSTIAELTAARERLIAELARRDAQYAQFVEGFRTSVRTIAETSEGRALLAQRRPGNLATVRALLVDLAQARNAAIEQRANIERAANLRAVAQIAFDDNARGEAATAEVISLYEEVTQFDPGVHLDWIQLSRLYQAAHNLPAARSAAERAVDTAASEWDRSIALLELGVVRQFQGELATARSSMEQSLAINRRLADVNPASGNLQYEDLQRNVAATLGRISSVALAQGDLATAKARAVEGAVILQRLADTDPTSAEARYNLALGQTRVIEAMMALDDLTHARLLSEESLAGLRRLAAADPGSARLQRAIAVNISTVGAILVRQGDLAGARTRFEESLYIFERLAAADQSSARMQDDVRIERTNLAAVERALRGLAPKSESHQDRP